jgi:hypothetical protein
VSRNLHLPAVRRGDDGRVWIVLPILAAALVVLVWLGRRAGKREPLPAQVGTAPAGAPRAPERVAPFAERLAPAAAPGTASGAVAASGAAAGGGRARSPVPVATTDESGTESARDLAAAAPDLAAWASDLAGDTGEIGEAIARAGDLASASPTLKRDGGTAAGETPDLTTPTAAPAEGPTGVAPEGEANGETVPIPTPAEESTEVSNVGEGWIRGDGSSGCPEDFPIKGNASSRIYHLQGEPSYGATVPDLCFATEEAAAALGYRPRKR